MVTFRLEPDDHCKVSEAIAAAESASYHDVALHWAVAGMILVLALASWQTALLTKIWDRLFADWGQHATPGQLLFFVMILAVLKFLGVLLVLKWKPLRLALTPGATKSRRVRRRAIALFRAAAERRTVGRTGVLIYLSLAEHRAEIVADEAVARLTTPECWGDAMAELIGEVREGRPGNGLAMAVEEVGEVLARHFPKTGTDVNEIPDKLIEL